MSSLEFHENHQQGEGGRELSEEEKADKQEKETEDRVEQAEDDPEVLSTPTEIRQGGNTGNLTGN